ncbi:16S rRNA (guanine(966)-N(2))-methyltransferase RsmD [Marinicella meishanensis]|uniref:16S rRNA (guanine(966)-N(2))-methyltransferase RsmD n=1 Tax=Marinicella meishanensis TaxID=2873263 RepID=UPI001CC0BACF|nr:16S rRNA (guanine(966)-N(2))-methyltransferase RsmD [Marinicella sp. NBU2979]
MGQIRITGGSHRSRKIKVEDQPGLRPTADRIRETLFNWLGQNLHGWSVLDLYAGSGILGFEAASRGASRVLCVDNNRVTVQQLQQNQSVLQLPAIDIRHQSAQHFVHQASTQQLAAFDLVFLDPPFDSDELPAISGIITPLIRPDGWLYREYGRQQDIGPLDAAHWTLVKQKQAGQVCFELWQKT